jgi:parvulin-like peptidyl-prolyl isomerase
MRTHRDAAVLLVLLISIAGCQKSSKDQAGAGSQGSGQATGSGHGMTHAAGPGSGSGSAAVDPPKDIDSKDILARSETTPEVQVKHVLIGWKDLSNRGRSDPRAAKRSNAEAVTLAQDVATKLKANPDSIDELMQANSEDTASLTGDPYVVRADSPYVAPFKNLALRLKEKEVGIVMTNFGYHVMIRVPPPPPDPLQSADILARPAGDAGPFHIQQILIGWKDTVASRSGQGDPRGVARTKADADKIAQDVLGKARAKGADMAKLMKEFSEDPQSKDNGQVVPVTLDMQVPPAFEPLKNLVVRLKLDEVGLVKSPLGWHIIKRVKAPPPPPPPKPDPLDSAEILKRAPQANAVKVKHILLGWTEAHAEDPRGTKRDRATLEKLVKDTVAKLVKGEKIEPLMAELSEDTSNAKAGASYDVSPGSGMVAPFENLSLRLKVGEVGVVKTQFGIHIIKRVE